VLKHEQFTNILLINNRLHLGLQFFNIQIINYYFFIILSWLLHQISLWLILQLY